jgi:hypothetical protein
MVAVRFTTSHQLHKRQHLKKGEGIRDIFNNVKSFANNVRNRIVNSSSKKQGAKDLKEAANNFKKFDEEEHNAKLNSSVYRRNPQRAQELINKRYEMQEKSKTNNASYKNQPMFYDRNNLPTPPIVKNSLNNNMQHLKKQIQKKFY